MAETLPIEIGADRCCRKQAQCHIFHHKISIFFWRNPITGCYARAMGGRSIFTISEAAQSLSALMWINQARFNAREHEAGLSGSDSSDRYPVGDRSIARSCSATGITCRTANAELTEQSQRRPVITPSCAAGIFAV